MVPQPKLTAAQADSKHGLKQHVIVWQVLSSHGTAIALFALEYASSNVSQWSLCKRNA